MSEEISVIRASCRKHNGSYRRKLRKLYSETPAAAQIIEAQVSNGKLTEQEFGLSSVEKVVRTNNGPYLYNVSWDNTLNGPDAFIGNEKVLKKFISDFKNNTENEIREILIKQYQHNKSLEDDQEYEEIVFPKIKKN